ncbi:MAG: DoxX family protein [Pseudolysinimonas sp.]|uniref:DoxX family protein n=1 Tax=Pseudolysinimonas sp. TaxID=2680009 RepID=UPI003265C62D
MEIAVWIVSGLLAFAFVVGGVARLVVPAERYADIPNQQWIRAVPRRGVIAISLAEILGAGGLVVPMLTGILPVLAPIAACCLALIMAGALVFHLRRREWPNVPVALVLIALLLFVAIARFSGV